MVDGKDAESGHDKEPIVPGSTIHIGDLVAGKYRILGMLAIGGVGMVLEAEDVKLERVVAVKLLLPNRAQDPVIAARFEKEARSAVKLKSEHVARIIELGELDNHQPFMVLEFLEGQDLANHIAEKGPLDPRTAADYTLQACEALAEAHALGLVHRDLKPANLFLANRPGGTRILKVIDFGLAKTTSFARTAASGPDTSITSATDVVGTPRYMAPEQLRGNKQIDGRVDIWALGATLYEMVSGRPAFDGRSVAGVWDAILHGRPAPLCELRKDVVPQLDAVVARCLEKDPRARYGSVAELAADLVELGSPESRVHAVRAIRVSREGAVGGSEPPVTAPVDRPEDGTTTLLSRLRRAARVTSPQTKTSVLIATAAVAALVGIAGGTVFALRQGTKDLGSTCTENRECRSSACIEGLCSRRCTSPVDCGGDTQCLGGRCQRPLRVGFVYVGVPQDQGWTFSHERGRKEVEKRLPFLVSSFRTNVNQPEDAERVIDEMVRDGFEVVVANSFTLRGAMTSKAKQHPHVRFVVYAPHVDASPNLGAYYANIYQGWYLAGYAAAQKSKSGRLGFVGSLVLPEVVRDINAFARGARRFNPEAEVEVRWIGFWFDPDGPDEDGKYAEERLAEELAATGCDVIAHHADNGRVVATVEKRSPQSILSIGNNSHNACDSGPATCLGVVHVNWGPLYEQLFEHLHRRTWDPKNLYLQSMRANPEESVVQFLMNADVAGSNLEISVAELLSRLSRSGGSEVFEGPYCSTGQRPSCVDAGQALDQQELLSMCWYVEGVIEKSDPKDPSSPDRPARVPEACAKNR